jgi:hypothetical protein
MALNIVLSVYFDNCGTGKEYGKKLGNSIVQKLI